MCKNFSHIARLPLCAITIILPNKDLSVFNITALPLDIVFLFLTRLEKIFSLFFESGSWRWIALQSVKVELGIYFFTYVVSVE